jgi:hypothetical protein
MSARTIFGLAVMGSTLLVGCGGDTPSSADAPRLDVTGIWEGATDAGVQLQARIVWTLTQSGSRVSGTSVVRPTGTGSVLTGTIEGTVTASGAVSGTMALQPITHTEPGCTITATTNGPVVINGRILTARYTQVHRNNLCPGFLWGVADAYQAVRDVIPNRPSPCLAGWALRSPFCGPRHGRTSSGICRWENPRDAEMRPRRGGRAPLKTDRWDAVDLREHRPSIGLVPVRRGVALTVTFPFRRDGAVEKR